MSVHFLKSPDRVGKAGQTELFPVISLQTSSPAPIPAQPPVQQLQGPRSSSPPWALPWAWSQQRRNKQSGFYRAGTSQGTGHTPAPPSRTQEAPPIRHHLHNTPPPQHPSHSGLPQGGLGKLIQPVSPGKEQLSPRATGYSDQSSEDKWQSLTEPQILGNRGYPRKGKACPSP